MRFRSFLALLAALLLLAPPIGHFMNAGAAEKAAGKKSGKKGPKAAPTPEPRLDGIHPYVTFANDPTRTMMINWWNPEAISDGTVLYGPTEAYGSTATTPEKSNYHHVELKGLTPGATYHYKVTSSDGTSSGDATFTTAEENDTNFMFVVSGDSRGNGTPEDLTIYNPRHREAYDHIASKKPVFTINVGDLAATGSNKGAWAQFFNCEANCLKSAPYMVSMGNHEVNGTAQWPDAFLYYPLFVPAYPANGTPGDSGQPTALGMNYSYNWGNAHFAFLSSFKMTPKSQAEWLDKDLAAARANPQIKWLFAVMHAPMYTWGASHKPEAAEVEAWAPIFDKHHVDIVFAGHNHYYERSHVIKGNKIVETEDPAQGTIYMTTGLGGAPFAKPAPPDPSYPFILKFYNETCAAAFVQIDGGKLEMKFITPQEKLIDEFKIEKK